MASLPLNPCHVFFKFPKCFSINQWKLKKLFHAFRYARRYAVTDTHFKADIFAVAGMQFYSWVFSQNAIGIFSFQIQSLKALDASVYGLRGSDSGTNSGTLEPNRMLIVDGPLQFIRQDTGKPEFADMFYNVVGVSKSFDTMLPTSAKSKRGGTQIGAELLKLEYGQRTPVFLKENSKHRKFGCWYLRIRPKSRVAGPLEGIIKIEKMAVLEEDDGLDTSVVDNISLWLLNEGAPTCYGRDERWANHLYSLHEKSAKDGALYKRDKKRTGNLSDSGFFWSR